MPVPNKCREMILHHHGGCLLNATCCSLSECSEALLQCMYISISCQSGSKFFHSEQNDWMLQGFFHWLFQEPCRRIFNHLSRLRGTHQSSPLICCLNAPSVAPSVSFRAKQVNAPRLLPQGMSISISCQSVWLLRVFPFRAKRVNAPRLLLQGMSISISCQSVWLPRVFSFRAKWVLVNAPRLLLQGMSISISCQSERLLYMFKNLQICRFLITQTIQVRQSQRSEETAKAWCWESTSS